PVTTTIFASEAEISAAFAEKVPTQMGIFFARNSVLQLLLLPVWRAEPLIVPLCHSATLSFRTSSTLLCRDCPTALMSIVMLLM
ncbi:hypothetical protein, partial [Aeromonas allosaccharophila]|uniref:hypothetical protein n=1 Tax=Aeromonas allosaccharophila TaxID=656 RepID=UPI0035BA63A9